MWRILRSISGLSIFHVSILTQGTWPLVDCWQYDRNHVRWTASFCTTPWNRWHLCKENFPLVFGPFNIQILGVIWLQNGCNHWAWTNSTRVSNFKYTFTLTVVCRIVRRLLISVHKCQFTGMADTHEYWSQHRAHLLYSLIFHGLDLIIFSKCKNQNSQKYTRFVQIGYFYRV